MCVCGETCLLFGCYSMEFLPVLAAVLHRFSLRVFPLEFFARAAAGTRAVGMVSTQCEECDEVPEGELQNSLGDRPASHATYAVHYSFDGACIRSSNTKYALYGNSMNRVIVNPVCTYTGEDIRRNLHRRTNSVQNNNVLSTFMSVPCDRSEVVFSWWNECYNSNMGDLSMAGEGTKLESKLHKRTSAFAFRQKREVVMAHYAYD